MLHLSKSQIKIIRPKFLLKGLHFQSVGQKAKTGLNTRYKVWIHLKADEHVAHVLSLNASCRKETLIISSRGLELLPPLFFVFQNRKNSGGEEEWTGRVTGPTATSKQKRSNSLRSMCEEGLVLVFDCVRVSEIRGLTVIYTQIIKSMPRWQPHTTPNCVFHHLKRHKSHKSSC